jgi:hypothetical protein
MDNETFVDVLVTEQNIFQYACTGMWCSLYVKRLKNVVQSPHTHAHKQFYVIALNRWTLSVLKAVLLPPVQVI